MAYSRLCHRDAIDATTRESTRLKERRPCRDGINRRRSSDLTSAYALLVEPTEKYVNQKTHPQKHFVPGTWAVLTYVRQDRWVADEASLDMDIKRCSHFLVREEGNHSREEGWYLLRGLESAMLSFDFRHLPNELVYDEHYRLAIFVRPSRCVEEECDAARNFLGPKERYPCRQPIHLSNWC